MPPSPSRTCRSSCAPIVREGVRAPRHAGRILVGTLPDSTSSHRLCNPGEMTVSPTLARRRRAWTPPDARCGSIRAARPRPSGAADSRIPASAPPTHRHRPAAELHGGPEEGPVAQPQGRHEALGTRVPLRRGGPRGPGPPSGEPYVEHPIAVIGPRRAEAGHTTLTAALLHDTVEDTSVGLGDIERSSATRSPGSSTGSPNSTSWSSAAGSSPKPRTSARRSSRWPATSGAVRQARRPPAQHAHAVRALRGAPAEERERDLEIYARSRTGSGSKS